MNAAWWAAGAFAALFLSCHGAHATNAPCGTDGECKGDPITTSPNPSPPPVVTGGSPPPPPPPTTRVVYASPAPGVSNPCGGFALPADAVATAQGLKGDPFLVYEFLYDNIATLPQAGSLKGPLATLLDKSGTPMDIAELGMTLIQYGGGASACSAQIVQGYVTIDPATLATWTGMDTANVGGNLGGVQALLTAGGFVDPGGGQAYLTTTQAGGIGAQISWAWLSASSGGQTLVFDPASPSKFVRSAGLRSSLSSAIGNYTPGSLETLGDSGATADNGTSGSSVSLDSGLALSGVNRSSVRSALTAYSNNLANYLRAQLASSTPGAPAPTMAQTLGEAAIAPLTPLYTPQFTPQCGRSSAVAALCRTSLPNQTGTATLVGSVPAAQRAMLVLQQKDMGLELHFRAADVAGRRLTIGFDANKAPNFYLDGALVASGTAPSSGLYEFFVTVQHPYTLQHVFTDLDSQPISSGGSGYLNAVASPGAVVLIDTAFGPTSRSQVERHRALLRQAASAHPSWKTSSSLADLEPVEGETLALIAATWNAETSRVNQLVDDVAGVTSLTQHVIGVVGLQTVGSSPSPYLDIPYGARSVIQRSQRNNGSFATNVEWSGFLTEAAMASALEGGVIEQTLPLTANGAPKMQAASTIRYLDQWAQNASGQFFDIPDCTTYANKIRPRLYNAYFGPSAPANGVYGGSDLQTMDNLVGVNPYTGSCAGQTGLRLIVPSVDNIPIGQAMGTGFLVLGPQASAVGSIITGGISGGAAGVPTPDVSMAAVPSPDTSDKGQAGGLLDPTAGKFTYSATPLSVGARGFPFGLGLTLSYDSGDSGSGNSNLGAGWRHNFDISAIADSDGFEALASTSAVSGASAIATLYVIQDLLSPTSVGFVSMNKLVLAAVAERFLTDQLTGNVIRVAQGHSSQTFVRLPDGSYNPPVGSTDTLSGGVSSSVKLMAKDGTKLQFDTAASGAIALLTWTNPQGATVSLNYDTNLLSIKGVFRLTSVSSGFGNTLSFNYDANSLLSSVQDQTGRAAQLPRTSGSPTTLASISDPLARQTAFGYDGAGRVVTVTDPQAGASGGQPMVTNTYDGAGNLRTQKNASGQTTTYYVSGARTEVVNPVGGRGITYFDPLGRTTASFLIGDATPNTFFASITTLPVFEFTTYQRDGQERVLVSTAEEGDSTSYAYDAWGDVTSMTQTPKPGSGGAARTMTMTYPGSTSGCSAPYHLPCTTSDFAGNVTTFAYDVQGDVTSITQPAPASGASSPVTTFGSYYYGIPQLVTDAAGRVTQYNLDAPTAHLNSIVKDPNGIKLTTSYAYDAVGNTTGVTDGLGHATTYAYDTARQLTDVTPPSPFQANTTHYDYDRDGRLIDQKRADGAGGYQTVSRAYTATGKLATTTDASGNTTSYAYDGADRFLRTTDPLGRTAENNCWIDALGFLKARCYGNNNADGRAHEIFFQDYTPNGLPWSRYGAGNTANATITEYDGFDRPASRSYAYGAVAESWTYAPNSDDVATHVTRAGNTVTYAYDNLHRLTLRTGHGAERTSDYKWDPTGLITSTLINGNFGHAYQYDQVGRRSQDKVGFTDATTFSVQYAYDAAGNLLSETYPYGDVAQYQYDALNREYDATWVSHEELWNNSYDALDRLTQIRFGEPGVFGTSYTWQGDDELLAAVEAQLGHDANNVARGYGTSYAYSAARQVASETRQILGVTYAQSNPSAAKGIANANPNGFDEAVSGVGGQSLSYDGDGNLTSDGVNTYTWDEMQEGRLFTAYPTAQGSQVLSRYNYDAFGRRVSKYVGGQTTNYVADQYGREIAEFDAGGNLLKENFFSANQAAPVAVVDSTRAVTFNHTDRLGSVVMTSSNGTYAAASDYLPYGETANMPASGFGYAGYRYDAETGLYHTASRYYDPVAGRFLSPDPIGYAGGHSLYAYTGADPVNNTDPSGLAYLTCCEVSTRAGGADTGYTINFGCDQCGSGGGGGGGNGRGGGQESSSPEQYANEIRDALISNGTWSVNESFAVDILVERYPQVQLVQGSPLLGAEVGAAIGELKALKPIIQAEQAEADALLQDMNSGPGKYSRPSNATTPEQRASVQDQPCVTCGQVTDKQVADHIDPLVEQYYRNDGEIDLQAARSLDAVQPQCPTCSARQGGFLSGFSRAMRKLFGY